MGNGSMSPRRPAFTVAGAAGGAEARPAATLAGQPGWLAALQLGGLWTLAVAQPLFDLLGSTPEFFIAHDTHPGNLLGLVLLLCAAGPAGCLAALRLGRFVGVRTHAVTAGVAVGVLAAAIALAAMKQTADWNGNVSLAVAAVCGAVAGGGYARWATIRLFTTFLSPAMLVAPALFLMQPAITPLLSTSDAGPGPLEVIVPDETPPVVVVVFDQLPLASLLDGDGGLDSALYPNFAALADQATWFRNASAVSGWTATALPAILTGNYPRPGLLPTVDHHPANLFTLLGSRYELHVAEPLTDLCPATLCPPGREGTAAWYRAVLSDLAVVYLHAVLPRDFADGLAPVTRNWRGFAAEDLFIGRWDTQRTDDRRTAATDFIAAIEEVPDNGRPPLHFLHVLLPHEPWIHLRTGQRHTLRPQIVAAFRDHWREDVWAVTREYQRHLLQVQFVDTLLGELVQRMRAAGLYDDALLVVTADHGASLRPDTPFRVSTAETFADIAAVPLIVKQPHQRRGRVSDANVETIDILPTVAAEIGLRLPWDADGANAFGEPRTARDTKTVFLAGATDRLHGPGDLGDALGVAVAHKLERFDAGDPTRPRLGAHDEIVGARVADLQSGLPAGFDVLIEASSLLDDVDRDAEFVPAHITGRVIGPVDGTVVPPLAVAVNGVVAAVTRTYPFPAFGHATPWDVIVDPRRFESGANDVRVFAIRTTRDGAVALDEARDAGALRSQVNLVPEPAETVRGVTSSGLLPTESTAHGDLRWTTGRARLTAPIDPRSPPFALTVHVLTTGPQKRLRLAVNGCTLFEGAVFGRWTETFELDGCRVDSSPLEIELVSNVHLSEEKPGLELGVAVGAIELRFAEPQR